MSPNGAPPHMSKHDERADGDYRTKRVILELYDAMAKGAQRGKAYETRLEQPPGDASGADLDRCGAWTL